MHVDDIKHDENNEYDEKKRKYFERLNAMTLEERVRRIEEMQFDRQYSQRSNAFTKY